MKRKKINGEGPKKYFQAGVIIFFYFFFVADKFFVRCSKKIEGLWGKGVIFFFFLFFSSLFLFFFPRYTFFFKEDPNFFCGGGNKKNSHPLKKIYIYIWLVIYINFHQVLVLVLYHLFPINMKEGTG